jgi:release factor glutamine methyltransferase
MTAPGQETVWTIGKLIDWTTAWFSEKGIEGGRLAAELLLARALNCRKIELYTRYDQVPPDDQRAVFRELVRQAGQHTPIAYLLGHREFFSLEFTVTPAVLIPRPDTETLVQRAIQICRSEPQRTFQVLDIGTGSGCIAISIAKYASNAVVTASDISPEAVDVARGNVERHGLTERVRVIQADLAHLETASVPAGGFDLVVSNPPYVAECIWEELPPHIREHEPRIALTPGPEGLEIHRRLAAEVPDVLAPGGTLLVEIGSGSSHRASTPDQLTALPPLFESGGWSYVGSHRDESDPHERVLEFRLAASRA